MQEFFIGVDVSKDWLDIHHSCRGPEFQSEVQRS
jgi:hypothetical protein